MPGVHNGVREEQHLPPLVSMRDSTSTFLSSSQCLVMLLVMSILPGPVLTLSTELHYLKIWKKWVKIHAKINILARLHCIIIFRFFSLKLASFWYLNLCGANLPRILFSWHDITLHEDELLKLLRHEDDLVLGLAETLKIGPNSRWRKIRTRSWTWLTLTKPYHTKPNLYTQSGLAYTVIISHQILM